MPANLTPEAEAKWKEAQAAKNPREKLQAYQEFLALMPKHKGNERLQAQVKTKIAGLKQELITLRGRKGGGYSPWTVKREGAAQVMLFGATNAGRSSLLGALTNARPLVASHDYTTQLPALGMLNFEDIQIQIVELPAVLATKTGEFEIRNEEVDLIRSADGLVLVLDASRDLSQQFTGLTAALEKHSISIEKLTSRVEIIPGKGSGEIRIATSGVQKSCNPEQVRDLLHSYHLKNALVRIYGDATLDDVEDAILENVTLHKPTMALVNKIDMPGTQLAYTTFIQSTPTSVNAQPISCLTGAGLKEVGAFIFMSLSLVRVYTKEPNESKPSSHPFVVRAGTNVRELARSIHTDLAERYRYSRIWGPTSKFAGERVGPDHVLGDRDIVEIHTD